MKNIVILIAMLFSLHSFVYAQNFKGKTEKIIISEPKESLKTGEKLEYSVEWLGIPVGKIILKVEDSVMIDGRQCYHITAHSFPNNFIRKLFDLEYKVDTFLDTQTLLTRRYVKERKFRGESAYVLIDFDQAKHKATYKTWGETEGFLISRRRDKMKIEHTLDIPPNTQDLLSSFYYYRLIKINEGKAYPVNIYYDQANWPVLMQVDKPFLKEMRKIGNFEVVNVEINSELNDYIMGKHKFLVYLTVDPRRIPVEFKVGTSLGYIRGIIANLTEQ